MTGNSLIDSVLEEINRDYHPGTLAWMKRTRPQEWKEMISLEVKINQAALSKEERNLREALNDYQELLLKMVWIFKTPERMTGNLFL